MITKEIEIDKIEIVFQEAEDGNRYPHVQSRGKVVIREDGKKIADGGTFRFGAKAPDQDAGDQPDVTFSGQKLALSQAVKDQLRAAQNAYVSTETKTAYEKLKADKGKELGA